METAKALGKISKRVRLMLETIDANAIDQQNSLDAMQRAIGEPRSAVLPKPEGFWASVISAPTLFGELAGVKATLAELLKNSHKGYEGIMGALSAMRADVGTIRSTVATNEDYLRYGYVANREMLTKLAAALLPEDADEQSYRLILSDLMAAVTDAKEAAITVTAENEVNIVARISELRQEVHQLASTGNHGTTLAQIDHALASRMTPAITSMTVLIHKADAIIDALSKLNAKASAIDNATAQMLSRQERVADRDAKDARVLEALMRDTQEQLAAIERRMFPEAES
jgi:hypothetical protein